MRSLLLAALLLSSVTYAFGRDQAFDPQAIVGDWVVQAVFCHDCGDRQPAELGTEIHIGLSAILNPLGGDCQDSPGFGAFRSTSWKTVADRAGILPTQARSIADASQLVMQGSITCGGISYFPVITINDATALYPFDGELTFLLARRPPCPKAHNRRS
jgi:hypothetical protein